MKCIPGKTTRTYCVHCHSQGEITGYISPMVHMACQTCGAAWRTISAICEGCRTLSGRPYLEDCPRCPGKRKQAKKNAAAQDSGQMNFDL